MAAACIDFSKIFFFFEFSIPFVYYSLLVHSFYFTYTTVLAIITK
jgi:hypothetical protein